MKIDDPLFFRVNELLEHIEEYTVRALRNVIERRPAEELIVNIRRVKVHASLEAAASPDTKMAARRTADVALIEIIDYLTRLRRKAHPHKDTGDIPDAIIEEAISRINLVSRLLDQARKGVDKNGEGKLIVPGEAPAPLRVAVIQDRIELIAPKKHIGSVPDPSIDKLRMAARDILRRAVSSLGEVGNADPRFIPCCEGLILELAAPLEDISIEALGLNWQITSEALGITQDSIPDIILAQLRRALTTIDVILGQYEEWQIYIAAEAGAKLKPDEVVALAEQAILLSREFENSNDVADARIPARLQAIVDPLATGIIQADTIGVPLMGSLSNIFAALSHAALEALPGGSSATGKISGGILITNLALTLISKFAPTLSAFPPLSWIANVHAELMKHWSTIEDPIKPS